MILKDKYVLRQLKIVSCFQLSDDLDCYSESERDGRSDIQILADEAGYIVSLFEEEGTLHYYDLREAQSVLRKTKNGKVIPIDPRTFKLKYRPSQIDYHRGIVNEYRRLKSLIRRLEKKGIYSRWL